MGIECDIVGIEPADEKFKQMKSIWDACKAAGVKVPDEVSKFFEGVPPDDAGVTVYFDSDVFRWQDDYRSGFQVDLESLDPSITMLRFEISS